MGCWTDRGWTKRPPVGGTLGHKPKFMIIQKISDYFVIHKVHLPDSFYDCHYDFHIFFSIISQRQLHNFF